MKLSTPFSLNTLQTQINKDSNHQLEAAPYGSDQNWFYIPFAAIADSSINCIQCLFSRYFQYPIIPVLNIITKFFKIIETAKSPQ